MTPPASAVFPENLRGGMDFTSATAVKSRATFTSFPNATTASSSRWSACSSRRTSSRNPGRAAFRLSPFGPAIEPETSRRRMTAQRGSGFDFALEAASDFFEERLGSIMETLLGLWPVKGPGSGDLDCGHGRGELCFELLHALLHGAEKFVVRDGAFRA